MNVKTYRVRATPEVRLMCSAPDFDSMSFDPSRRSEPMKMQEEIVPLFFEHDWDGHELISSIYEAIQAVYRDTARRPERVLVGRYTFVELWAHLENQVRSGRQHGFELRTRDLESGKMELFGVEIQAASGADHFIAAQPVLSYLMVKGIPEGAVRLCSR